jgi:hypothetical protein
MSYDGGLKGIDTSASITALVADGSYVHDWTGYSIAFNDVGGWTINNTSGNIFFNSTTGAVNIQGNTGSQIASLTGDVELLATAGDIILDAIATGTIEITQAPTLDNDGTQMLMRDPITGHMVLRDVSSLPIPVAQTLTWTDGTNNLAISGGNSVIITGFADSSHTHTASDITDFDTEVGNNVDVAANTAVRHAAVTVADTSEIDLTLVGQHITAAIVASSIDESKLDASVNTSLDLADSASQPGHTHVASDITDFDVEVSNNPDVAANTSARHDAVTVADTAEIDIALVGQLISASIVASSIDETKLDASVNTSLDLADSSLQTSDIGVNVQGYDPILAATTASFLTADKTKLDGIEALADVTDTTNVDAAGAVMNTDATTATMAFVIDEDDLVSNLDTKVPTQQSVKAYVDGAVASSVVHKGSYDAATNTPDLDTSPSGVLTGHMYTVTVAGTFFTTPLEVGDVLIADQDAPTLESHWTIVNKNLDEASIKVLYESNADTNEFSDAEQTKLAGIEALADVTDTTNVTAAGALMDSEVDADIKTLALPANTSISIFGASLIDDTTAAAARTTLDVDQAGTDNSTDVTLTGSGTYISIAGQIITVDAITESDISDLGAYLTNITAEPLSDLSDATITAITGGEILRWNGSAWVNNTLAEAGISAASHTHIASEITDFDTEVSNNSSVVANTAKVTNVSTNLSITGTTGARTIVSSDGTDAIIPIATTLVGGVMSTTIFDEHVLNNAKVSDVNHNVSTNLSVTNITATTLRVDSSDGTNAIIPAATVSTAGLLTTAKWGEIVANNAKVSDVNHNVTTNLGYTASPTNGIVTSSDGTNATLTLATGVNAGLMTPAYFTSLASTSGSNTGDQTSIVGISGTKVQFNTALTDGTFLFVGDAPTAHTHTFASLTSKPTTIAGYGITDFNSLWDTRLGTKSTSNLLEGSNLYYTESRVNANSSVTANTAKVGFTEPLVLATDLLGLSLAVSTDVVAADSILVAVGKLQAQIDIIPVGAHYNTADFTTDFAAESTTNLSEGTNLYYTEGRVSANSSVVANTAKVSNATHTGDVTGSTALTIAANAVTLSKMADMATDSFIGRDTAGTGDPEVLSAATARAILNVENGATADQSAGEIEAIVNHDNLVGFVGNEHIDWTVDQGATNIHTGNYINTLYSHPTQTARSISTAGAEVMAVFTSNTEGHVTNATKRTMTLANLGYTGSTTANDYTHPSYATTNINTSGANIVDIITTTAEGHISAMSTRVLTLADLGYTGTTNANTYVHPSNVTSNINTSGATIVDLITTSSEGHITAMGTRVLTLADLGYTGTTDANTYVLPFTNNSANWNTAFGWGDHSVAGYLTSETDSQTLSYVDATGILTISGGNTANLGITATNKANWNTAYSWGDHAGIYDLLGHTHSASEVTSGSFSSARIRGIGVTDTRAVNDNPSAYANAAYFDFKTRTAVDTPDGDCTYIGLFTISPWSGDSGDEDYQIAFSNTAGVPEPSIRAGLDAGWNSWNRMWTESDISLSDVALGVTANSWGDHSVAGYLTSETDSQTLSYVDSTGILTISGGNTADLGVTTTDKSNWDTAFGWGDHASAGHTSRTLTLANLGYTGTTDANTYVHPTTAGNKHIPTAGASGQYLKWSASGTAVWDTITHTEISDFDAGVAGAASVIANTAKVTNATHTGDVTGSGALTISSSAITSKTALTSGLAGTDELFVSDGGTLKRMDVSVMNAYFNANLSFQASGTYNTIIGTDTDISYAGATVLSTVTLTDGVVQGHTSRTLTLANLGYTGSTTANDYTHPSYATTNINTSGATIVDLITTTSEGHISAMSTRVLTLADLGYTGTTNANTYVHPSHPGDDFSIDTGALSGATVISDVDINVTTDTLGHVTDANASIATRVLTLANLGLTGTAAEYNILDLSGRTAGDIYSADTATTASWKAAPAAGATSLDELSDVDVDTVDPTKTSNVAAVGHLWINSTTSEMWLCLDATTNDNVWLNVGLGSGRINHSLAVFGSGINSSGMEYIPTTSAGGAVSFGSLSTDREEPAGLASESRVVWGGGYLTNVIDYMTIANLADAVDFGNLSSSRYNVSGCSNATRGLFIGGTSLGTDRDIIEYITIASTGNTTDFGDLTAARDKIGSCSSSTRALFGGGEAPFSLNIIEYVTIASTGNATYFGDATSQIQSGAAASDGIKGFHAGGCTGPGCDPQSSIDQITMASTGNATDWGDLNAADYNNSGACWHL